MYILELESYTILFPGSLYFLSPAGGGGGGEKRDPGNEVVFQPTVQCMWSLNP